MKKRIIILSIVFSFLISVVAQTATQISAHGEPVQTIDDTATQSAEELHVVPPAQPINLTLSPYSLQFDIDPGGEQTSEIKIRNNGTEDEPLQVGFATFSYNTQTQQIDLNQTPEGEFMNWISVDRQKFIVHPGEWESVNVTFAPPKDAALTYYYALVFSRIDQQTSEKDAAKISGAPAALILTNVYSPYAKRQLELESFKVPKFWIEFLPQTFLVNIINSGNIHTVPTGNIFIEGQGRKDIAVLSLNPDKRVVLPNSTRMLEVVWKDGFPVYTENEKPPDGSTDQKKKTELKWDFSKADRFRIGKYTAHLLLVYDNGTRDELVESYVNFWVIPWRICLAVFVSIILLVIGFRTVVVFVLRVLSRRKQKVSSS